MNVLSLFAGIGGFDLGLERAGMTCTGQVEIDAKCRDVLDFHFPRVARHDDVRSVDGSRLTVRPDLICGGFPCQDLSVAGRRAGLAGERSGLFWELCRIVAALRPRWLLLENVPGLLSSHGGQDMLAVLRALWDLGYGAAYRVLDAQWFGLAQRRRRVFIVGCAGTSWRRAAQVLVERESLPWHSPPSREAGARVAHCLTACATASGRHDPTQDTLVPFDRGSITSPGNHANPKPGDPCYTLSARDNDSIPAVAYRTTGNDGCYETGDKTGALNTGTDRNQHVVAYQCHGSNVGPMGTLRSGNGNETGGVPFTLAIRGRDGGQQVEYRRDNTANALMSHQGGRSGCGLGAIAHQTRVRRLTPTECERLQGFPDGWTAGHSDSARYKMIGNAVAVPVAEWIGRRIMEAADA